MNQEAQDEQSHRSVIILIEQYCIMGDPKCYLYIFGLTIYSW